MQGNVVWNGRYKAWGRLLHVEREIEQPLRFQGQYEDQETGLFYNRYRYYDPDVARYVTQDPIGLLGGINSYLYSASPTTMTDPLGLVCGKANPSKVDKDGNGRFRDQYGRFAADPGWPQTVASMIYLMNFRYCQ
nr:RHS repeat-associated core domain-containing protein [uncultured Janthinobacterium sp.]